MTRGHPIERALDLVRMPTLARTVVAPPIPPGVAELMQIAAAARKPCEEAAAATGQPVAAVIEAARFYLQQLLFRADADCYRILGLEPGASRATARRHMRWLLQWLHPDRNSGLDAVYAERALKAWREISTGEFAVERTRGRPTAPKAGRRRGAVRLPWIQYPAAAATSRGLSPAFVLWALPAGLAFAFVALWSVAYFLGSDQTAALLRLP